MKKMFNFGVPGVLLIGLFIRFIGINQSLWLDEATTALVTKMSFSDIFSKFLPGDFHPPLYYLLLKIWSGLFGYSEIALRIPSVIFGVLTIYVIYLIGKRVYDKKIAIIASLLLATSGLHIYYSQEARMYSLAALLVSCLVYLFLQESWVFFSIVLGLIGMTDYVSLTILPALWLYAVVIKQNKKWWKIFLISHIPLIAVFVFWLPTFATQLKNGIGLSVTAPGWWNILGQVTLKNIALIPIKFIFGRVSLDNKIIYGVVAIVVGAIFAYLILRARKSLFVWAWLGISLILGIALSFIIPTLSYFRYLFALPAFYLLLAAGISTVKKTWFRAFVAVILLINLTSSFAYLLLPRFWREDWKSAATALGNEKIVFPSNSQKEALIYYGKEGQIISISQIEKEDNQIWLSRYVWEIFDSTDITKKKIESLGYNKIGESNFNGVIFYKYENRN